MRSNGCRMRSRRRRSKSKRQPTSWHRHCHAGRRPMSPSWRGSRPRRRDRLDELVDLERRWPEAASGKSLLHLDVRADNVLLTPDRVHFVDWPWAAVGARWLDVVAMLPSVVMQGGPPPRTSGTRIRGVPAWTTTRSTASSPHSPACSRSAGCSPLHRVCRRCARSRPFRAGTLARGWPAVAAGSMRWRRPRCSRSSSSERHSEVASSFAQR